MSRIFLSHSSKDDFAAIAVRAWLNESGWDDVFLDLDPKEGIHPGERWERALYEHAVRCEAVLFLVSHSWLASNWCRREYELARRLNKRIFVVLIDDLTIRELPPYLTETHQAVSLAAGSDHRVRRVERPGTHEEGHVTFSTEGLARLRAGLAQAGLDPRFFAWPPATDPDRDPYRGLEPLEAVDAGIFFGRDAPVIEALDALRGLREASGPRLFVILGASGAGKSSFLRAGMLPRLGRDDRNFLPLAPIRPERMALTGANGLIAALLTTCAEKGMPTTRAQLRDATLRGAAELRPYLRELIARARSEASAPNEPTILIAVDQAEELFKAEGAQEGNALLMLLSDLARKDNPAIIALFAIRSDSYDALEHAKALEGMSQRVFPLLPMPRGAYQIVIEGPARRFVQSGRSFEIDPSLTQMLLSDLEKGGGSDSLPLLAFTLGQLFADNKAAGRLSRVDYENFGGLKGAIDAAVSRVFAAADKDARIPRDGDARLALLRRGLVPWLAGIDPETKTPRRRRAPAREIPSEARPLIDLLVEQRLLTRAIDDTTQEVTLEPAHEALLRQWGSLKGWLDEDFAHLVVLEGVQRASREWDANARDAAWAAHSGGRLEEAARLDARPDLAALLHATDRAYLAACREKQTEAHARERALAAAERRATQRTKIGLAASIVFGLMAVGAAVYGFHQANIAGEQRREAEDQRTVAERQKLEAERQKQEAEQQKQQAEAQFRIATEQRAIAEREQARADDQRGAAETERSQAEFQRNEALMTQSRFLVDRSDQKFKAGDSVTAALLALEALPDMRGASTRPYVANAEGRLDRAWRHQYPGLMPRDTHILVGHDGAIQACAISPDGETVVTGDNDGTARIWSLHTGKEIRKLPHTNAISKVFFRKSGKLIVARTESDLDIWDMESFQHLSTISDVPESYSVSPDASRILTVNKAVVQIRASEDGKVLRTFNRGRVLGHRFGPEGPRVVIAETAKTVALYDPSSNALLGKLQLTHPGNVILEEASFSPDGRRLAIVNNSFTVNFFDIAKKQLIKSMRSSEPVNLEGLGSAVFFSADGKRAVIPATQGFEIYDIERGEILANVPIEIENGSLASVSLSSDGSYVVTAAAPMDDSENPRTAKIWDGTNGSLITTLNHAGDVACTDVGAEDRRVLTAGSDRIGRIWEFDAKNAPAGKSYELRGKHDEDVDFLEFSPDGRRLLVVARNDARVWDAESGALLSVLKGHRGVVLMGRFDATGARVFTRGDDNTARIWDAKSGRQLHLLSGHAARILDGGFTNNDRHAITVGDDHTLRLWDAESGQLARADNFAPGSLKVLSDERRYGRRVLVHRPDGVLELRDPLTGHLVRELDMPRGDISFFSPFFAVSGDRTLYLWNEETGVPAGSVSLAETKFHGAEVSGDGKRLVTTHRVGQASETGIIRTWDTSTGTKLSEIDSGQTRAFATWLSQDGTRLLIANIDGSKYFDTSTGKELMNEVAGRPMGVAYSKNGDRIAVSAIRKSDDTLHVLDAKTGGTVAAIIPGPGYSKVVAYNPDGTRVAIERGSGVAIWHVAANSQALADLMKASVPRCLSSAQREEAFLSPAPPDWCVEMEKWPFHTQDWKDWLGFKRANANPPLPYANEWRNWIAIRKRAN